MNKKQTINYMPGLDGLRAIAVIAIIIFHLNPKLLPGGFLGVDTFFIISGFLITTILLREFRQTGTINFVHFWIKRFRRLFPAVFFMIITVFCYCLFFKEHLLMQLKADIIAAFLYVSNWWYIFDKVDYFHSFDPRPLQHLWSLAIEEQFYLLFPLILYVMLAIRSKKIAMLFFTLLMLCSMVWMMTLYHPGVQISRLYFGTDTRLQTLILGVLLAFVWPVDRLKSNPSRRAAVSVSIIGLLSFIVLIYGFFTIHEDHPFLYQGGFFIVGCITLFVIAASVFRTSWLAALLSLPPLVMIGRYSYSLYLWHFPVITLLPGDHSILSILYKLTLIFILALSSYHWIETPFRKEGLRYFTNIHSIGRFASLFIILYAIAFSGYQFLNVQEKQVIHTTSTISDIPSPTQLPLMTVEETDMTPDQLIAPLFIGDSILVDIYPQLKQLYPNAIIDGEVGRSIYKAIPLASKYSYFNEKDNIVVLGIGTNGDFEMTQLNTLLRSFNKTKIYLITAKVPLDYEEHVNELMKKAAAQYKNVHIIDWYTASKGHNEYFAPDGIHLEPSGVEAMNTLIKETIK